jgi:hypothetical protein
VILKTLSAASLVIALAGIVACNQEPASPHQARAILSACDPEDQQDYFGGQLTTRADQREVAQSHSQQLRALGEPPLYCGRPGFDEEYRLLERTPFSDVYVDMVRVSKRGDEYRISGATTLPRSLRFGGEMRFGRQLASSEWQRIVAAIEPLRLWQTPLRPPDLATPPKQDVVVMYDGPSYVLEGRKAGRYRARGMKLEDRDAFETVGADLPGYCS